MLRCLFHVSRYLRPAICSTRISSPIQCFSMLNRGNHILSSASPLTICTPLASNPKVLEISQNLNAVPVRSVTKFSLKKGKRKTVKAALKRFYRLNWGGWIRPKVARNKRIWKKSPGARVRAKQHVLVTAAQATLLDKMVTNYWKRPKYYVDDPYAPYHSREHFNITRKKPVD